MSSIDLIILGIVRENPRSAYDLQKEIKFRNISSMVKISSPSVYKRVIQLEKQGYIEGELFKEGSTPEKKIYSINDNGITYHKELMLKMASSPMNIFLDMNSVIMNLDYYSKEEKVTYLSLIRVELERLIKQINDNIKVKNNIPYIGKQILYQQLELTNTIQSWLDNLEENL